MPAPANPWTCRAMAPAASRRSSATCPIVTGLTGTMRGQGAAPACPNLPLHVSGVPCSTHRPLRRPCPPHPASATSRSISATSPADPGAVAWLEIHAENYMGAGGRPLAQLRHLSERFPISVHGVGLSIGGEGHSTPTTWPGSKHLCGWLEPASFSEHLAWSTHDSHFLNDLLPLPYTAATLARVCDHIDEVQEAWAGRCCWKTPQATSPSTKAPGRNRFPATRWPAHRLRPVAGCEQRLRLGHQPGYGCARLYRRLSAGPRGRDPSWRP